MIVKSSQKPPEKAPLCPKRFTYTLFWDSARLSCRAVSSGKLFLSVRLTGTTSNTTRCQGHGDSIHAAVYSCLTYSNGSANDFGTDYFWSLHLSVHAAHQHDHIQFHYGLGLTFGDYTMGSWRVDSGYGYSLTPNTALPTAAQLNTYSGSYFFGGVGFQGGINGVMPFRRANGVTWVWKPR